MPATDEDGYPVPCMCLCPQHKRDGMFCQGAAIYRVWLTGGPIKPAVPVAMCGPCTTWRRARTTQVSHVGILH